MGIERYKKNASRLMNVSSSHSHMSSLEEERLRSTESRRRRRSSEEATTATLTPTPDASFLEEAPLPLFGQDRVLDPVVVGAHSRVDAGHVGPTAADAEAHDAHLVPLAVLFAHQRTAAVALEMH